ncbi:MAG TPA: DUF2147 domain-containing protein [Bradyrhizobium sp.]|nr:DUF2147 domain-containing protein [Bradyrhizobium sp.]
MRRAIVITISILLTGIPARAEEPTGEWRVEDGSAIIKIDNCRGALWGVVTWEKSPGRDNHNPNPTLRGRPLLGSAVIINMRKSAQERWDGQVYNAQNGKTYTANIRLAGGNALRIQGCMLGGVLCGGQQWTRVANAAGRGARGDVCSRVSNLSGPTH